MKQTKKLKLEVNMNHELTLKEKITKVRDYLKTSYQTGNGFKISVRNRQQMGIVVEVKKAPFEIFTKETREAQINDNYLGNSYREYEELHRGNDQVPKLTAGGWLLIKDISVLLDTYTTKLGDPQSDWSSRDLYNLMIVSG